MVSSSGSSSAAETTTTVTETSAQTETTTEAATETVTETTTSASETETVTSEEESSLHDESSESEPPEEQLSSLRERSVVTYGGSEIVPGDKIDEVTALIGEPLTEPEKSSVCDPDAIDGTVLTYFYPGMNISVNYEGRIADIALTQYDNPGGDAAIKAGVKPGDTPEYVKEKLGVPAGEDTYGLDYTEDTLRVYFFLMDGAVDTVNISDSTVKY